MFSFLSRKHFPKKEKYIKRKKGFQTAQKQLSLATLLFEAFLKPNPHFINRTLGNRISCLV